ncbi:MAG: hypothetical protein R3F61_08720 [Myxococcota bacterium]
MVVLCMVGALAADVPTVEIALDGTLQTVTLPDVGEDQLVRLVFTGDRKGVRAVARGAAFRWTGEDGNHSWSGRDYEHIEADGELLVQVGDGSPAGVIVGKPASGLDPNTFVGQPPADGAFFDRAFQNYAVWRTNTWGDPPVVDDAVRQAAYAKAPEVFFGYLTAAGVEKCPPDSVKAKERVLFVGPSGGQFELVRKDGSAVRCDLRQPDDHWDDSVDTCRYGKQPTLEFVLPDGEKGLVAHGGTTPTLCAPPVAVLSATAGTHSGGGRPHQRLACRRRPTSHRGPAPPVASADRRRAR